MIPRKISRYALAARSIRNELKSIFPGVKFTVRSSSFANGDSVWVEWENGPSHQEVSDLIGKYQHGSFDGMDDHYTYRETRFHKEFGSAKYVQCQRRITVATDQ